MRVENHRAIDDRIPEGYCIVYSQIQNVWFWLNEDTYAMSENEWETPEEALEDLLQTLKPVAKKTWAEKQADAKRKRDEHNKAVLRSYRIK